MAVKRLREEEEKANATMVDRLTSMPESLQLRILSSLDARHAVRTSMLSKSWVSAWSCIPILNFSSYGFKNFVVFEEFIIKTLSLRQSVKLDKLTIKHDGMCRDNVLKKVFVYAFSHGIKELEADIKNIKSKSWPIWLRTSVDSLTSLKLGSTYHMDLGQSSGVFNNLINLDLKRVIITDLDTFAGFPALEKLRLVYCYVSTKGNVLHVHTLQLLELSLLYNHHVSSLELTTPKLRYFEYRGFSSPRLTTHQGGLPVLDQVILDYTTFFGQKKEKKKIFDDLLMLFNSLKNAKMLTIFSPVFQLLAFFPGELVNRCSPFVGVKRLKLDFTLCFSQSKLSEFLILVPVVKSYLLQKSHDAKCSIAYHDFVLKMGSFVMRSDSCYSSLHALVRP